MTHALFLTWRHQLRADHCYTDFAGATITGAQTAYEVALLHHLAPTENRGRHHTFVDLVDADGRLLRDTNLRIGWSWEGRRADEPAPTMSLDKGSNEPAGNVPIYRGMKLSIWLETPNGERVSEIVHGLHGLVEDVGQGNTWHHNSFYIIFRERMAPTIPVVTPPAPVDLVERVAALEADVQILKRLAGMT